MPTEITVPDVYGLALLLGGIACFLHFIFFSAGPKKIQRDRGVPGWRPGFLSFFIGGIFLVSVVLSTQIFLAGLAPSSWIAAETPQQIVVFGFAMHLTALTVLFALYKAFPNKFQEPFVVRPMNWPRAFVMALYAFLALLPVLYPIALGWKYLLELMGIEAQTQDTVLLFSQVDNLPLLILMVVLTVVVAPVSEELLFRGCLYRFLKGRTRVVPALIISGLLFSMLHYNLLGLLPLFILGLALAYAYEKSGDIKVPILLHGIFNLNTVLLILLTKDLV